jgi:hypothetical protein
VHFGGKQFETTNCEEENNIFDADILQTRRSLGFKIHFNSRGVVVWD